MKGLATLILLFLATPGLGQEKAMDQAIDSALDSYPTRRYLTGSADAILGGITGVGGFILSLDASRPGDETLVGLGGTLVGALMGFDGLIRLFQPDAIEWEARFVKKMPEGGDKIWKSRLEYGRAILERSAERSRGARRLRIIGGLLSSSFHLYLFQKGQDRYKALVYPGAALGLVALYRLFVESPEESAWNGLSQKTGWKLEVKPNGLALVF